MNIEIEFIDDASGGTIASLVVHHLPREGERVYFSSQFRQGGEWLVRDVSHLYDLVVGERVRILIRLVRP